MAKSPAKQEAKITPIKQEAQQARATPGAEPKPRKKRWRLKTVIALLVLGGGGAGIWYAMEAPATAGPEAAAPKEKAPVFANLEPFTVNLQPENGDQYLQVGLVVKVTETAAVDAVKLQMPEIRNRILLLLSSKRASEISTVAGKQQLSAEIMNEVRQPLGSQKLQQGIVGVFFTSFVIQ